MASEADSDTWFLEVEGVEAAYSRGIYETVDRERQLISISELRLRSRCIEPQRFAGREALLKLIWEPRLDDMADGVTEAAALGWAHVRRPIFELSLFIPRRDAELLTALATGGQLKFFTASGPRLRRSHSTITDFHFSTVRE